jgi:hypothetical protein
VCPHLSSHTNKCLSTANWFTSEYFLHLSHQAQEESFQDSFTVLIVFNNSDLQGHIGSLSNTLSLL